MAMAASGAAVDVVRVRSRRKDEEPVHDASHQPRPAPDHDLLRLQTTVGNQATVAHVQRQRHGAAPRVGTRFRHPAGVRSPHRSITAEFDGQTFRVHAGSTALMQVDAASGRPVSVRSGDARTCGGATSESYKNNPRYVGISDYGPIPEGTFTFSATEFGLFSPVEQARMITGGSFTDPFGQALHGGDWGAGRAPQRVLPPRRVVERVVGLHRRRQRRHHATAAAPGRVHRRRHGDRPLRPPRAGRGAGGAGDRWRHVSGPARTDLGRPRPRCLGPVVGQRKRRPATALVFVGGGPG
jgi:hypothetical protein